MEVPMLRKLRSQLSYANVAATLALLIAVGGGSAYAASQIRSRDIGRHAVTASKLAFNAVTASKVRNSALSGKDLRNESVTTSDVDNGTLRAQDFAPGQLPPGPKGDKGDPATSIFGVVSAGGVLGSGKGVTAVSSGTGSTYTVTINQDVSKCAVVATVASTDGGLVSWAPGGTVQQIVFKTRNLAGGPTDLPFSFAVYC